ncbi:putative membrane protein [Clostridium bornimense]|uniref:Putative membrane protein n=1 Tax=Clostridium bornimense TaxID=1216932 RepID=W6S0J7_9CLOT|nr:hypothetical protein [Clostridium bornimense]CDM70416.1 putative membrane protein [Clostridium bornimense]
MKNIKNILWFSLRSYKIFYALLLSILFVLAILDIFIFNCPLGADLITFMSIITTVVFIFLIIEFCNEISKGQGRLLFITPIKAWEFLSAKYILHMVVQIIIVATISFIAFIGNVKLESEIFITGLSLLGSFTVMYIIICSFIIVYGSYISNDGIVVVLVVITSIILPSAAAWIIDKVLIFLPYIYLKIGSVEIDILFSIAAITLITALMVISTKLLKLKLDIN